MSPYNPINDDHAVETVTFQLVNGAPFHPDVYGAALANHGLWSEELPAVAFSSGEAERVQQGFLSPSATFSYMRPDGSAVWQMKFDMGGITVACARYSRWEKIWPTALSLLQRAVSILPTDGDHRSTTSLRLQVVDKFQAFEPEWEAQGLFEPGGTYIPDITRLSGPIWHTHNGWFVNSDFGAVLNHLNVSSSRDETLPGAPRILTAIHHLQEMRLADHLSLVFDDEVFAVWDKAMRHLHDANKATISSLLIEEIRKKIGLTVEAASRGRA